MKNSKNSINSTFNLTGIFRTFTYIPYSGLFAILDNLGKKIYLGYSQDVLLALMSNKRKIDLCLHDTKELLGKELDYYVLESCSDEEHPLRFNYWLDKYKQLGYIDCRNYKPISYAFCTTVRNFPHPQSSPKIFLELVSKNRQKRILLGVFDTRNSSKNFIAKNYSKGIYKIIRATNKLTKIALLSN